MPDQTERLYEEVCTHARRTALWTSIESVLGWDQRTQMPAAAAEYRADQMTLLARVIHEHWTDPDFGRRLGELADTLSGTPADQGMEDADRTPFSRADMAVTVRRLKRRHDRKMKLPPTLVEELARTSVLGEAAWAEARRKNDFPSFRPLLERLVELKRQEADALGYPQCRYDALLDDYEPEALTSNVAQVLDALRQPLVELVQSIADSTRRPDVSVLHRRYPVAAQEAFGRQAASQIGFDFQRGRLDVTVHPFCSGLGPNDCRITTRYDEHFFNTAFFGILHEAGHGIYDQGLRADQYGLPLGDAASLGIHESQSRMWENLVGRSRAFFEYLYPLAQRNFPEALSDVSLDTFYFAINEVRRSLIRVEADEATYNLHILVRFELEQDLLEGNLPVADLPSAWREKYGQYLGVRPATDTEGVLQDVHWSAGLLGYFPTYTLGNLFAAQLFAQADAELGGLAGLFARGQFDLLRRWLNDKVHCQGQRWSSAELVRRVTGRPPDAQPLVEHLRAKFGQLYGL